MYMAFASKSMSKQYIYIYIYIHIVCSILRFAHPCNSIWRWLMSGCALRLAKSEQPLSHSATLPEWLGQPLSHSAILPEWLGQPLSHSAKVAEWLPHLSRHNESSGSECKIYYPDVFFLRSGWMWSTNDVGFFCRVIAFLARFLC